MQSSHPRQRRLRAAVIRPIAQALSVVVVGMGLSACESVATADWIDPANWFKDDAPEPRTEAAAETRQRGEEAAELAVDAPFPNLATVPDRPDPTAASVRERVAEGLAADRENARYTADAVARLGYVEVPADGEANAAPLTAAANGAPPVEVATIYFAANSTSLQPGDEAVLRDVAILHEQLGGSLLLVGHASRGQSELGVLDEEVVNLGVSLDRALAVAEMLTTLGVAVDKVAMEGRGDNQPLYQETAATGEAGNRRTVIYLLR